MKLRNKKTGEIRNAVDIDMYTDSVYLKVSDGEFDNETIEYHSLAEFNAEWEDAPEEPKDFWYIDDFMIMCGTEGEFTTPDLGSFTEKDIEKLKAIGNYFSSREEAEKAVEKLKAVKRLKDKGFRFDGYDIADRVGGDAIICGQVYFKAGNYDKEEIENDLYLLFGGEE